MWATDNEGFSDGDSNDRAPSSIARETRVVAEVEKPVSRVARRSSRRSLATVRRAGRLLSATRLLTTENSTCTQFREQGTSAQPLDKRQHQLGCCLGQQGAEFKLGRFCSFEL